MRRPFALLALAALTWSNATALQCARATPVPEGPSAAEEQPAHGHHDHAPSSPERDGAPGHTHDGSSTHPPTPDCGVMMACGAALRAQGLESDQVAPTAFDAVAACLTAPSAADLARDPPPPRHNA